jgi:hypothetical protein
MDVRNELYHMTELRKMNVRNKINSLQNGLGYIMADEGEEVSYCRE